MCCIFNGKCQSSWPRGDLSGEMGRARIIRLLILYHNSTPSVHDWQTLLDADTVVFSLLGAGYFCIIINILNSIILKHYKNLIIYV